MIHFSRFTLDNGLRVIHHHDPHTPMVALDLLYDVGARDEAPELTGMAHLFEHLMFGGSQNIPEFDTAIENAGGWNNAWTSNDFTNFYDVVPAVNAETAFWLESDRMLALAFSPKALEVQRKVVSEEFKQVCLNKPYGDMAHHLRRTLYTTHPYAWPTIGKELGHIEKVTDDDVRHWFYAHYAPNNAVLAVAGNLSADDTRRLAEKWFGPIPRRDIARRSYLPEPIKEAPVTIEVEGRVPQTLVTVAFPMAAYGEEGYVEADLITDLLASGRSARFHRNLVMRHQLFTRADASIAGSEEPGFLMLNAAISANDTSSIEQARKLMVDEALRLAAAGDVTAHELERAVNRFESNATFNAMSYLMKAQQLAMAEMHGEDINDTVPRYRAVTTDSVRTTAARVLDPSRAVTLIYRPA